MDSAAALDAFFAFQDNEFGSAQALDDDSFAGLSEALAASNAATSQYDENWMMDSTLLDLSNNSTASSSPFTPSASISRPKLGSRFSREVIRTLKEWLSVHQKHPYPSESEIIALQDRTGLNKAQLTNWFANARRRGKVQSVRLTSQVKNLPTSPIDIIPRPGTPAIRMASNHKDPLQRWVESPPEHEPAAVGDIARAMASTSHEDAGDFVYHQPWQSPCAMSAASSARTSQSSEFSGHCSSGSQNSLKVRRAPRKKRATRRRLLETEVTAPISMPYQCTFCTEVFKTKYDWQRHEKSLHIPLERWICALQGPRTTNEALGEQCCVFCGEVQPDDAHIESHHYSACQERSLQERTFHRKDHLVQHLRLVHNVKFSDWSMARWMLPIPDVRSRCGFCGTTMRTWSERTDHIADHFKSGVTMASWQGDWGFDASVTSLVETAIAPDLIDWERNTFIPMKGSDPSWGTPPNAYELLKVEIEFFIQRYYDKHGHLPDNDSMQLEACRIIFTAETTSVVHGSETDHLHEVSWLRDLMMSSPELTERARFEPVRSSRESRYFPLRINAKDHLFKHCPLEAQLRGLVIQRAEAGETLSDAQLHHEACQIIWRMEQESSTPSDVFANWIVKGIYSGTNWISLFKQRVAVFDTVSTDAIENGLNQLRDHSWLHSPHQEASNSALGTESSFKQTHDFFTSLSTFSEESPITPESTTQTGMYGQMRSLLPDDTNFHRIFDSDMRRWVASTLSPNNPNCHVPSDEEIQHHARWIMYDGDDPWNQTPADFPKWLSRFKKEVGIVSSSGVVNPTDLVMKLQ